MKLTDPVGSCGSVNVVVPVVPVVSVVPQLHAVVVGVVVQTAEEVGAQVEEKQSLKSKSMLVFGLNEIVAKMS